MNHRTVIKFLSACLIPLLACGTKNTGTPETTLFDNAFDKGILDNPKISEASGLAAGRTNKNLFWTHNDSGDEPRLFAFDDKGQSKGTYYLLNVKNRDWEDIASVSLNGTNYLYVADIGDNDQKHARKFIYRVKEPLIEPAHKSKIDTISAIETFVVTYPDGERNAEAMMLDQQTGDVYIVTKFESNVKVYFIKAPLSIAKPNVAKVLMTLPLTYITAADIAPNNQEILMKNLDNVYYWKRLKDESIADALKRPATILPYKKEPQGEAIAFANDGTGYYTVSEVKHKISAHLYFYKRK